MIYVYYFIPGLTVVPLKKKKLGKNPDVDTSFLPDREREVIMMSKIVKKNYCSRQWETASLILCLYWSACANACGLNRGWRPFCFSVT